MAKVLIALDGSKASMKAVEYVASRKRRGEDMEVLLLNVQPAIAPRAGLISNRMVRDYQAAECEKVFSKSELVTLKKYLRADAYMEVGEPARCIIEFARKAECNEIVIGSRGLGSVKGLFLGSVANKVIQMSRIPVIVVK